MSARPNQAARWCWDGAPGALVQPPSLTAAAGFSTGQRPPAQWINYQFNSLGAWIDYLRGPNVEHWNRTAWGTSPGTYDAAAEVLIAVDTTTVDAVGAAFRYVIAGWETTGPTTSLQVSRRGTDWARRTNIDAGVGRPTALASWVNSGGAAGWLLADHLAAIFYCTADAGGATAPVGATGSNWSVGAAADDGSGAMTAVAAFANDPVTGSIFAVTAAGGVYSSAPTAWSGSATAFDAATPRTGAGLDVVWDGANYVFVTDQGEIYSCGTAGGSFVRQGVLAPGAGGWSLCAGETGEVLAYRRANSSTVDLYFSDDSGATWTAITPTTGFNRINRIRYHDGTWMGVTTRAPFAWTSSDLSTWLKLTMPVSGTDLELRDIAWDGGAWIAVGNGWVIQCPRGADPSDALYVASATAGTLTDAAYLRGRLVASTAPTDGEVLRWESGAARWEPSRVHALVPFVEVGVATGDNATPASSTPVRVPLAGAATGWTPPRADLYFLTGLSVLLSGNAAGSDAIFSVYINGAPASPAVDATVASGARIAVATCTPLALALADIVEVYARTGTGWTGTGLDAVATLEIGT